MSREDLIFTWLKKSEQYIKKLRAKDRVVFIEKTFDNMEYEIDNLFKFYNEQELKENDKMFDVNNINVGDYVETVDGCFGYISHIVTDYPFIKLEVTYKHKLVGKVKTFDVDYHEGTFKVQLPNGSKWLDLSKMFKRIGRYTFQSEPEKKEKIERIDSACIQFADGYSYKKDHVIVDKINEIIDYINNKE